MKRTILISLAGGVPSVIGVSAAMIVADRTTAAL
jgi:hypothetical protein